MYQTDKHNWKNWIWKIGFFLNEHQPSLNQKHSLTGYWCSTPPPLC